MAPTLRSGQASKTVDNRSGQASETVDDQTAPAIDTPDTANGAEGAAAEAGNSNDTDDDVEAATAHNQEVIDRQWQQIRHVQQEIKYKENEWELERLNSLLWEGPKVAMTIPENNGGFTSGVQHWTKTDIAPPPFQRLIKPREPCPYAGGPKGSRQRPQEYLKEINQSRELMPEQFPTKWDFIVWAGTYLKKTAMNDWQKQKEQHNHAWVTYDNYLKVFKKDLSPDEDTDEQNIIAFNAAEPNANDTITSWYDKLSELYHFLPATQKGIGKIFIQDHWRAWLPYHILTELQHWDLTQVTRQSVHKISAELDAVVDSKLFQSCSNSKKDRQPKAGNTKRSMTRILYYDKSNSTTEAFRHQPLGCGRDFWQGSQWGSRRDQGRNPNYLPITKKMSTTSVQNSAGPPQKRGDFVPKDEVDAQKAASLCIKCGVTSHWINKCKTGWSTAATAGVNASKWLAANLQLASLPIADGIPELIGGQLEVDLPGAFGRNVIHNYMIDNGNQGNTVT